jgi:hypothetical protein
MSHGLEEFCFVCDERVKDGESKVQGKERRLDKERRAKKEKSEAKSENTTCSTSELYHDITLLEPASETR